MTLSAYEVITGVGTLYSAPVGEAFPTVGTTPAGNWVTLGETSGGVKVTFSQKTDIHRTDQRTGPVKATRSEEGILVETKLTQATLENLAKLMGLTVTDTPAGSGTIGTREMGLHRGATVTEYALLFRGSTQSPYGAYPAQYELPRGIFDDAVVAEYTVDKPVLFDVKFVALESLTASTEAERFGKLIVQDAAAL